MSRATSCGLMLVSAMVGACVLAAEASTGEAVAALCAPTPPCAPDDDVIFELGQPYDHRVGLRTWLYDNAGTEESTVYQSGINPQLLDTDKDGIWWALESNYEATPNEHKVEAYVHYVYEQGGSHRPIMMRMVKETDDWRTTFNNDDAVFLGRNGAEIARFRSGGETRIRGYVKLWSGASIKAQTGPIPNATVLRIVNDELELDGAALGTRHMGSWACNGRTPQGPAVVSGETTEERLAGVEAALRAVGILQ